MFSIYSNQGTKVIKPEISMFYIPTFLYFTQSKIPLKTPNKKSALQKFTALPNPKR